MRRVASAHVAASLSRILFLLIWKFLSFEKRTSKNHPVPQGHVTVTLKVLLCLQAKAGELQFSSLGLVAEKLHSSVIYKLTHGLSALAPTGMSVGLLLVS